MIHYVGWYIAEGDEKRYVGNVPGRLKMRYVMRLLHDSGLEIDVLSLVERNKNGVWGKKYVDDNGIRINYVAGIRWSGNKIIERINKLYRKRQLISFLTRTCKADDIIILYHSVEYTKIVAKIKKRIKSTVVSEVEEIYGYSPIEDKPGVFDEINAIKKMDYFITVNRGLARTLGVDAKRCVTSYGVCIVPPRTVKRIDDGRIHVVYAGTIEKKKLGALTAVETARYLPQNYVMHIIGFGKEDAKNTMLELIERINAESSVHAKVQYDGYLTGESLDQYLYKCHIGLSSNVMRPNFANNSFPSKVITYMCHDLAVVLGYAEAFYDVPESEGWTFYMSHNPQAIAEAICNCNCVSEGYYHEIIDRMNMDLVAFFKGLLNIKEA